MDLREELAGHIVDEVLSPLGVGEITKTLIVEVLGHYCIERARRSSKGNAALYVQRFLDAKQVEGLSAKTLDNYRRYLMEFAKKTRKDINRITTDDVRAFISSKEVADSSKQTILCTLRSFFGWLTREEIIRKNPTLRIPGIKLKKKRIRKAMSQDTWELFRGAAKTLREKALIEMFYSTGCRVSEMANASIEDINLERRSMRVIGKGNKERTVYFSYKARVYLKKYLAGRKDSSSAVFANVRGGDRMSVRSIQKLVAAIGQRIKERSHPHKLRHTMAYHFLNKGGQLPTLQAILGHESPSTTQIYAQMSDRNICYEYDQIAA